MIDTDDLDRMLREALTGAAAHDVAPSAPAQLVALRLRRRQRRRIALRASVAAGVCVVIAGAVALSGRTTTPRPTPATRPVIPAPSVLSTRQNANDLAARARLAGLNTEIDWASVRLLTQIGTTRLYGARDTQGVLCVALLIADSSSTGCGSSTLPPALRDVAGKAFAARGTSEFTYTAKGGGVSALGLFVPDAAKRATLDGVPVPITRNGILVVFTSAKVPSLLTVASNTGTLRIAFVRQSDGSVEPAYSGGLG